ncbi:MAG TPA: DNA polymerase III subunit gamma/tau [Syntrophales bacterium]|nr:DNA polymerase III subunit gamma/tau [Syntrophales bacterium]
MEYLVLARKWRPQVFEDVVGQDHVTKTLGNAVRQGRVAHALLFSGPRGIGKTSVARILAKALNCEKGPTGIPCNGCVNCREITDGISMDVREIDGASNRGIDEIRELRENVRFTPASAPCKVYIIDEVHMLTKEAFNALLKTIEEPPRHVIFIFATTEIHRVPMTILSRCQRHDFRRVSSAQIRGQLRKIADAESIRVGETALGWIAEAAEGSMRDAESIFDQVISYAGTEIREEAISDLLGRSDRKLITSLAGAILDRDGKKCLETAAEAYYAGLDLRQFHGRLTEHFLKLIVMKISGTDSGPADLSEEERKALGEQAEKASRETLRRMLDILLSSDEEMRRSGNPKMYFECVLIRLANLEPRLPLDEILAKIEYLEKKLSAEAEPNRSASFSPASAAGPEEAGQVMPKSSGDLWQEFKDLVKAKSPPLWSQVNAGVFLGCEDGRLRIGFPRDYLFMDSLRKNSRLSEIAAELLKREASVEIEALDAGAGESGLVRNGSLNNRKNHQQVRREALGNPMVQKILDVFEGAEIREVVPLEKKTKSED